MSIIRESWQQLADTLGFRTEEEMLRSLYSTMSIGEMASRLGYSNNNVRNRLVKLGIPLRKRGGPNRLGKGAVQALPDEVLEKITAEKAYALGFHPSSLHKERRRRKEYDTLRSNSPDRDPGEELAREIGLHDAGPIREG